MPSSSRQTRGHSACKCVDVTHTCVCVCVEIIFIDALFIGARHDTEATELVGLVHHRHLSVCVFCSCSFWSDTLRSCFAVAPEHTNR